MRANLIYTSDSCLYVHVHVHVCMNVSHRSKNKQEISPFSGNILRNEGSGDHREISYKQKMFFTGRKREREIEEKYFILLNILNVRGGGGDEV